MSTYLTADTIRSLREGKHLTQRELAEAVGVTNKAVSKWESGVRQNGLTGFCPAMIL